MSERATFRTKDVALQIQLRKRRIPLQHDSQGTSAINAKKVLPSAVRLLVLGQLRVSPLFLALRALSLSL